MNGEQVRPQLPPTWEGRCGGGGWAPSDPCFTMARCVERCAPDNLKDTGELYRLLLNLYPSSFRAEVRQDRDERHI